MAAPIIQSVGATSGPGIAGKARDDLVPGEQVNLSDEEAVNVGATYLWEFVDVPIDTSPVLTNPTTSTPHFTTDPDPAKAGTYRVKATVNGVESSSELLGVSLATTGSRIPAFKEETQFDGASNTKGWHPAQTKFMREVDQRLPQKDSVVLNHLVIGGRHSHNSDTPLVIGAVLFDPTIYDVPKATTVVELVAIGANGTTPLTAHVVLYNIDDDETVASSLITITDSTDPAEHAVTLSRGSGFGLLKNAERIYECRIYLDAPASDPETDTIEVLHVEIRVTRTIT